MYLASKNLSSSTQKPSLGYNECCNLQTWGRTCEMLEAEETQWSTSHFADVVSEALTAELAQSSWASGQDEGPGFLTPVLSIVHASPTEVPIKEKHASTLAHTHRKEPNNEEEQKQMCFCPSESQVLTVNLWHGKKSTSGCTIEC